MEVIKILLTIVAVTYFAGALASAIVMLIFRDTISKWVDLRIEGFGLMGKYILKGVGILILLTLL